MYSMNTDALQKWIHSNELTLHIGRDPRGFHTASLVGSDVDGTGTCPSSAMADMAKRLVEAGNVYINGKAHEIPELTKEITDVN